MTDSDTTTGAGSAHESDPFAFLDVCDHEVSYAEPDTDLYVIVETHDQRYAQIDGYDQALAYAVRHSIATGAPHRVYAPDAVEFDSAADDRASAWSFGTACCIVADGIVYMPPDAPCVPPPHASIVGALSDTDAVSVHQRAWQAVAEAASACLPANPAVIALSPAWTALANALANARASGALSDS